MRMQQLPTKVHRPQVLEGFAIPAVIHNGSYFFVDIDVYENGRVSCWKFEDFESFKRNVRRGWVKPAVPDGQLLSIHGLGSWLVTAGRWLYTAETFISYVEGLVRELNPTLENLYTYCEKKVNGVAVGGVGHRQSV